MYRSKWLKMQTTMLSVQNCKFETSFFYLCDLIPPFQRSSRNKSCTYEPFCRTVSFENPFYLHCVKSVQIRSYFWSVFSCIRAKYRKKRTRNNSVYGHFSRSGWIAFYAHFGMSFLETTNCYYFFVQKLSAGEKKNQMQILAS